jgi:hypothetical protein
MNIMMKNIGVAVLALAALCGCGPTVFIPEVKDRPFPNVGYIHGGGGVAVMCQRGDFTGEHIEKSIGWRYTIGLKEEPPRSGPGGQGKIYTRYLQDYEDIPPPVGQEKYGRKGREYWGYTFTIHTTDDGIITRCSATQQFLRRW